MSTIIKRYIDVDKCNGCKLCINDCVTKYIELVNNKAKFVERGRCIGCGHCDSICPNRAIEVKDEEYNDINSKEFNSQLLNILAKKRTVRNYIRGSKISKENLDDIIYAAYSSPTEKNRKSSKVLLIKDSLEEIYNLIVDSLLIEVKKTGSINPLYMPTIEMDKNRDDIIWGAEYLVAVVGIPSQLTESVIVAERMQLVASEANIGSAYRGDLKLGINMSQVVRNKLGISSNEECLVCFILGLTRNKYYKKSIKMNHRISFV